MAATSYHVRSVSLPSQPQPVSDDQAEEVLNIARRSLDSSLCSSSSSTIGGLYKSLEDLLKLGSTQKALFRHRSARWIKDMQDDSVQLLDVCGSTRDILLLVKEQAQDLQSVLRTRRDGNSGARSAISSYLSSRRHVNKEIKKHLATLQKMDKGSTLCQAMNIDADLSTTLKLSGELRAASYSVLSSILSSMSMSKPLARSSKWVLLSKATRKGTVAPEVDPSVFASTDASLCALREQTPKKMEEDHKGLQDVQKQLEAMEVCVMALELELGCLHRHLIQTRVSMLNILNM